MSVVVEVASRVERPWLEGIDWTAAVAGTLAAEGYHEGEVSLVLVDAETMHDLNRRHLDHDWTTDVLTFVYDVDEDAGRVTGEIIVSPDYAAREAAERSWSPDQELTLYAVHGALHLAGYDDVEPDDRRAMRAAERRHATRLFGSVPDGAIDND